MSDTPASNVAPATETPATETPAAEIPSIEAPYTQSSNTPELHVKGIIRVVLTRNIGSRAFQADKLTLGEGWTTKNPFTREVKRIIVGRKQKRLEAHAKRQYRMFERFRGTTEFAKAVKALREPVEDSGLFSFDDDAVEIQNTGYKLGVLSYYLYKNELMPIYTLNKKELKRRGIKPQVKLYGEAKEALKRLKLKEEEITEDLTNNLQAEWCRWPVMKVMLSRYGMYQVILECDFPKWTPITEVLRTVTGLEQKLELSKNLTLNERKKVLTAEIRQTKSDLAQLRPKSAQPETATAEAEVQTEAAEAEAAEAEVQTEAAAAQLKQAMEQSEAVEAQLKQDTAQIKQVKNQIKELKEQLKTSRKSDEDVETVQNSIDYSVQWEVVREIVAQFVEAFKGNLLIKEEEVEPGHRRRVENLHFNEEVREASTTGTTYNLRFRYVVFELHEMELRSPNTRNPAPKLPAQDGAPYAGSIRNSTCFTKAGKKHIERSITSLLEGALVKSGNARELPPFKQSVVDDFVKHDVSTWDGEYCLFTSDNAVISYNQLGSDLYANEPAVEAAHLGSIKYRTYWASIMRGVAYIAEMRLLAKLLAWETSDGLEYITTKIRSIHLRNPKEMKIVRRIMRTAIINVRNTSRLVARIRNTSVPTTIGVSDYAISKYRYLMQVLEMEKLIDHANSNLGLINSSLSRYDDMQLQLDTVYLQLEVKRDSVFTLILTIILTSMTAVLAWLGLPVFLQEIDNKVEPNEAIVNGLNQWFPGHSFTAEGLNEVTLNAAIVLGILALFIVAITIVRIVWIGRQRVEAYSILEDRFSKDDEPTW
jgi:hypothetical protein